MAGVELEDKTDALLKCSVNNSRVYLWSKRIFDIVASALALVVLALPLLVVAICIHVESPGPVIYKQERLGKGGKVFVMYKFRSMYQNSEKNGPQWAKINDDRCTKVGRFIRQYHIDELPQLWNVIKGDMSIVGPRPEREFFYCEFEKRVPGFRTRLLVDQGLTCIAQVNGCYDLTPEKRLVYDMEYMNGQSIWMDMKCILRTFSAIVTRRGAR